MGLLWDKLFFIMLHCDMRNPVFSMFSPSMLHCNIQNNSHYPHSKNPVKSRGLAIRDIYFSYYFCYYGFVRSKCFFFYTLPAHFILEFNVLLIAWILFLLWNSAVVVLLTAQSDILEAYTLPLSS